MLNKNLSKFFASKLGYTKYHTWIQYEPKNQLAKLGITNHAQKNLGDLSKISLPSIGEYFKGNQMMGQLESNGKIFKLYSPFALKIKKVNDEIFQDITVINQNPASSWLVEIQVDDIQEFVELLKLEEYEKIIENKNQKNDES